MQVTPGSQYLGCWDESVSPRVGNPSSCGTLSPGLGGRSGSALHLLLIKSQRPRTLGGPVPSPRLFSWSCSTSCSKRSWAPSNLGLPGRVPSAEGICGRFSSPSAWEQTQPIVKCSSAELVFESARPRYRLMSMDCRGERGRREAFWLKALVAAMRRCSCWSLAPATPARLWARRCRAPRFPLAEVT